MVKQVSIRIALSFAAQFDLEVEQMDVTTAFLHGELDETIHIKQPEGFHNGDESMACLLSKSLYGLKQSPRQLYKRFDLFMKSIGFDKSDYDSCVYQTGRYGEDQLLLLLYVDDMLIIRKNQQDIKNLKSKLKGEFEMKV